METIEEQSWKTSLSCLWGSIEEIEQGQLLTSENVLSWCLQAVRLYWHFRMWHLKFQYHKICQAKIQPPFLPFSLCYQSAAWQMFYLSRYKLGRQARTLSVMVFQGSALDSVDGDTVQVGGRSYKWCPSVLQILHILDIRYWYLPPCLNVKAWGIRICIYLSLVVVVSTVFRLGIRIIQPLPAANITVLVMAWEGGFTSH